MGNKKYIVSKNQMILLEQRLKENRDITDKIIKDINKIKKSLNESLQKDAISTVLSKYRKSGILNESVIKQLSNKGYKIKLVEAPIVQQTEPQQNQEGNGDLTDEFEEILRLTLDKTLQELPAIEHKVGNKDGELELLNSPEGQQQQPINNGFNRSDLDEGFALAGAVALSAPAIIGLVGKGLKQLGKSVDVTTLQNIGNSLYKASHKLEQVYTGRIMNYISKKHPDMKPDKKNAIIHTILLAATAGAGIASIAGVSSAGMSGNIDIGAIEAGIAAVEGMEFAALAVYLLPNIMNGFFK